RREPGGEARGERGAVGRGGRLRGGGAGADGALGEGAEGGAERLFFCGERREGGRGGEVVHRGQSTCAPGARFCLTRCMLAQGVLTRTVVTTCHLIWSLTLPPPFKWHKRRGLIHPAAWLC